VQVTYCPGHGNIDAQSIVGRGGISKGTDFFSYVLGCLFLDETTHACPL